MIEPGFDQLETGRKMRERRLVGICASCLLTGTKIELSELGTPVGRSHQASGKVQVTDDLEQALFALRRR